MPDVKAKNPPLFNNTHFSPTPPFLEKIFHLYPYCQLRSSLSPLVKGVGGGGGGGWTIWKTCPIFLHFPDQVNHECFPSISCYRETQKMFSYYQCVVESYTVLVLEFLLFDKSKYTSVIFQSVILVSTLRLHVYLTFSLFLKIWLI